jgi:hypothetical protein
MKPGRRRSSEPEPYIDVLGRPLDGVLQRLTSEVRSLGGNVLGEPCRPQKLGYNTIEDGWTCGCGGTTRFQLPWTDEDDAVRAVTLCGVCDAPYMMPRLGVV